MDYAAIRSHLRRCHFNEEEAEAMIDLFKNNFLDVQPDGEGGYMWRLTPLGLQAALEMQAIEAESFTKH